MGDIAEAFFQAACGKPQLERNRQTKTRLTGWVRSQRQHAVVV